MRTRSLAVRSLVVAVALSLGGCATLFTGTSDTLTFHSNVPGVRLSVDGRYLGELPLRVKMSRNFMGGQQFVARFEAPGHLPQEFKLQREFNTVAILDVTSLLTSAGIDVLTGSLLRFSPTEYHVQMLPEGESAGSPEFQRGLAIYRYALANHRSVQKDLARGGGTYVASFADVLCAGDPAAAALAAAAAVRHAPALVEASGPHDLVARVDRLLAGDAALRGCAL